MPASPRKPTMQDVARLARVSTMSVSRFITDETRVADETRARIRQAIDQLGYVPDRVAGSLSSRRTGFIAAVLPTLTNSNFADTAIGLTDAIRPAGYQLLIGYTMYSLGEEEAVIRGLLARRPEAIVVAGTHHTRASRQLLIGAGIPVVEIWSTPRQPIDHAVGFSNYEVGRAAAQHLIELGHRHIGAIGPAGDPDASDARGDERLEGFAAVLREAGLSTEHILRHGPVPFSFERGAAALSRLLEMAPETEAVFAVSDLGAVGALLECQRRGIAVPDRLSFIGFGDFEIGAQFVPSLTTIRVHAEDIGRRTGELIVELLDPTRRLERENGVGRSIDVGFVLVPRESTARRRKAAPRRAKSGSL